MPAIADSRILIMATHGFEESKLIERATGSTSSPHER